MNLIRFGTVEWGTVKKFKAVQIAMLFQVRQHSDNERIAEIIDLHLIPKLQHLRAMDLADYIFTSYLASREFNVFEELIPSEQEVDELIKQKNKLYYFKAKYISRLMRLRKELKQKYSNKADRIEEIVFNIATKLANLRRHTLADYMFSVTLACKEFAEFCSLVSTWQEIKQICDE
jgi:hypothetical protein